MGLSPGEEGRLSTRLIKASARERLMGLSPGEEGRLSTRLIKASARERLVGRHDAL
jgi:hypothetical protein